MKRKKTDKRHGGKTIACLRSKCIYDGGGRRRKEGVGARRVVAEEKWRGIATVFKLAWRGGGINRSQRNGVAGDGDGGDGDVW